MFYIAALFGCLMLGFGVIDFLEWREKRKTKLADDYHRSMLWAPKGKKG